MSDASPTEDVNPQPDPPGSQPEPDESAAAAPDYPPGPTATGDQDDEA